MTTHDDDSTLPGSAVSCMCPCRSQNLSHSHEPTLPAWEKVSADAVLTQTAAFYGVTVADVRGTERDAERPRNVAAYLCRQLTDLSLIDVGVALDRDYMFVLTAEKNVRKGIAVQLQLRDEVHKITARIAAATAT